MEFMLSEALPIYSGGLGNVAGDQLKAAHDLGVPVIGVGLLYQQGYFRQLIDEDGVQQAVYPYNDPGQLPITPLRQPNGEWLRLKMDLPGHSIWVRAWQARVGRSQLFLLDANDAANHPPYRGITAEFYGGGPELRLMQEMLLGIGGWQLLTALGIEPEVCHLNEGHAAFVVLERARSFMADTSVPFDVALAVTRKMSRSNSTPWVRGVRIPCANLCDARKTGRRPTARLSTARPCRRLGRPMISPRASCRITPAHPCRSRPPISSGNDDVLRPEVCVRS
jgi:alpha-glucan phosphorylase-like protein